MAATEPRGDTVDPHLGDETLAWPAVLDAAVAELVQVVRAGSSADWSSKAGRLDWDCRETVLHVASDFVGYAGQLTAPRPNGYVPFDVTLDGEPDAAELAEVMRATGGLLSSVGRTTPPEVLSWHPYGMAGRDDFCAMGVVEALVHAHDLSEGLHLEWQPPPWLAERVLRHLFGKSPSLDASWQALLLATGRIPDDDGVYVERWRWRTTGT